MPSTSLSPADFVPLQIIGRDATAFLQSQLATDLRARSVGSSAAACLLGANGRVLASGTVLRREADCWWWLLERNLAAVIASHLRRFVLRSKLQLETLDGMQLCDGGGDGAGLAGWTDPAGRQLSLRVQAVAADPPDAARFAAQAVDAGWLDFGLVHHDRFLPQMLDLQRFGALALDKGCYPGQEIVARSHYLGRIKRCLRQLQLDARPATESAVLDETGRSIGEWVSGVPCESGWRALAVVELGAARYFARSAAVADEVIEASIFVTSSANA